ncbi:MAG: hypothetical protein IKJ75_00220 [Clostridia bacterium]|nr:hypothetical protein [Clostridia bacterium]
MKIKKIFITLLVLGCFVFSMTGCNMEKCGEDMLEPTATPGQTQNPVNTPNATTQPQTTQGVPDGTDDSNSTRHRIDDSIINPTDIIEDFFDATHMPEGKAGR